MDYNSAGRKRFMTLLTDGEIRGAIQQGLVSIDPFDPEALQPASYDLKLGKKAIIAKSLSLEELKEKVAREEIKELDVEREMSVSIPGGGFALVTTLEKVRLAPSMAAHIGMKTYHVRKGVALLSGLQIDPGWEGNLVLGLANLSPRTITIEFKDPICSIELHRLSQEASKPYPGTYMAEQREGRIPKQDKDYLRTIETMSVSDLTRALLTLSGNVESLSRQFRYFWVPVGIVVLLALLDFLRG